MFDKTVILGRAIKKAEANGFTGLVKGWDIDLYTITGLQPHSEPYVKEPMGGGDWRAVPWQVLLFNHDFARALWPDPMPAVDDGGSFQGMPVFDASIRAGWQQHLQQLVIAEDPIAYLMKNI